MDQLNKSIEKIIHFDLSNREKYQKLHTSFGLFDGVLWILPILVAVPMLIYNGWFFLKRLLVENIEGLQIESAITANPKTNKIMLILLVIGLVLAVVEKIYIGKRAASNRIEKKRIERERGELLNACDLAANESGKEIYPFWHKFNGLTYKNNDHGDDMLLILPKKPIVQDSQGHYIADIADGLEMISGKLVLKMASSLEKPIYFFSEEISPDKRYWVDNLYLANFKSAEFTYTEEEDDGSRERKTNEYARKLDERERAYNLYTTGNYKTDQDMYFEGKGNASSYAIHSMVRDERIRKFKENVSGNFVTRTANEGMWRYWLHRSGYVVLDEECEKIVGVILINTNRCDSWYLLTSDYEPGANCRIKENTGIKMKFSKSSYASLSIDTPETMSNPPRKEKTLRSLPSYPLSSIDFSVPKPENATDEEWGLWIYSHYADSELFEEDNS